MASAVDSRWWYVVAAGTAYGALAMLVLLLAVPLLLLGALATGGEPAAVLGLSLAGVVLLVVPVVLVGVLLAFAFPVAIYLDADAVGEAGVGWEPDPLLYGLVGAVGLVGGGPPIQPLVGLYYLYRRHRHVGTP